LSTNHWHPYFMSIGLASVSVFFRLGFGTFPMVWYFAFYSFILIFFFTFDEVSMSKMTNDRFRLSKDFTITSFFFSFMTCHRIWLVRWYFAWVSRRIQLVEKELLTSSEHEFYIKKNILCSVICLFVLFLLTIYIFYHSAIYGFWIPVWYLQTFLIRGGWMFINVT
jgi:hypothetical protein